MKYTLKFLALGILLPMATPPSFASGETIVGTWSLKSMTYQDAATGKEDDLWGKDPAGFLTYTPGGRMSAVIAAASRKTSTASADQAPADEQAMLFRTAIAYAGTYRVTDAGVVHHVETATDPALAGKDQVRFVRFDGTRIVVTGPPLQTVSAANTVVLQLVWERIE